MYKVQAVNYQSLYRVRWLHDKAFAFLQAQGADAVGKLQQIYNHKRRQFQVCRLYAETTNPPVDLDLGVTCENTSDLR